MRCQMEATFSVEYIDLNRIFEVPAILNESAASWRFSKIKMVDINREFINKTRSLWWMNSTKFIVFYSCQLGSFPSSLLILEHQA